MPLIPPHSATKSFRSSRSQPDETREIVFKTMLDAEVHHTIQLDGAGPADYRSVIDSSRASY